MTVPVSTSSDAGALWIRLARPDKLNALSLAMADRIGTLLDEAGADNAIRVVVLTGSGRAFSAGADIDDISRVLADPEVAVREFVARGHRLTTRIE
jgi:enoyl-CoA hydratase/carnithine racemase